VLDPSDVEPSSRDVGRDEHRRRAVLEPGQRALARRLGEVAVHRLGLDALRSEPLHQPVDAPLGSNEHERQPLLLAGGKQVDERVDLVRLLDGDEAVIDLLDRLAVARDLVPGRVVGIGGRETAGGAVERGREEHRLALAREAAHDAVDLRLEPHVEHAVRLVEHQDADRVELDRAPVREVLEAPGRRDQDVGAARPLRLRTDLRAAVHGRDAQPARLRHVAELIGDLDGQLARRDEHQSGGATGRLDSLDDRDRERERLAGAGPRLGEHVAPGQGVGHDERLDREGRLDPSAREGRGHPLGHAERGERIGCGHAVLLRFGGRRGAGPRERSRTSRDRR
jgi:hypothetical protein